MSRNDSLEISRGGNGTYLCFDDGFTVAECYCGEELLHKLKAAPDMYEALKAYHAVVDHTRGCTECGEMGVCDICAELQYTSLRLTEEALMKSEGKQNDE